MILKDLGSSLKESVRGILGKSLLQEEDIKAFLNDLQRSLIKADVSIDLVKKITDSIKQELDEVPKGLTKKQYLVKLTYESLTSYLGKKSKLRITEKPFKIMLVGLNGAGKTTTAGKLANYYKKRGRKVALVQLDTYRPAAYEQLKQLGSKISVPVYGGEDSIEILDKYKNKFEEYGVVIADTAGRDALNEVLKNKMIQIKDKLTPSKILLTLPADIGKAAEKQARAFNKAVNIDGTIVTKLDGTAKGGGALTACAQAKAPILFIGTGEELSDLETYKPKRFVKRLIGLGDLETLLEKAEKSMEKEEARELRKRFMKGKFDLIDLYNQLKTLNKMGPLNSLMNMMPGLSLANIPDETLKMGQEKLQEFKIVMDSMTKEELENPSEINKLRRERIAKGSGVDEEVIRDLISRYNKAKKMMKMMKGKGGRKMKKMMKMMKKKGIGGGDLPF